MAGRRTANSPLIPAPAFAGGELQRESRAEGGVPQEGPAEERVFKYYQAN